MTTDELFDRLDDWGWPTLTPVTKRDAHKDGVPHMGMHLAVTDGHGNMFQQLRGKPPAVKILPNVWDPFLVAGHVAFGETPLDTLVRETAEEIGQHVTLEQLQQGGLRLVAVTPTVMWVDDPNMPGRGYWHRVFDYNFVVRLELTESRLVLERDKVIAVRRQPINLLQRQMTEPDWATKYQFSVRPPNNDAMYAAVLAGLLSL